MRQQIHCYWRSSYPNSCLSSYKSNLYKSENLRNQGMVTCLSWWTAGGRQKTSKIKIFHTTKCRAYPHEKHNTSNRVISRELVLITEKEIASALGKRSYKLAKEVKIGYCLESWVVRTSFKCQKYGHYREACRGQQTCGEKDPDDVEEDCLKEIRCANCRQDHSGYAISCFVYKKEKEIIEVKHKRNVSFLEATRIGGSYMGESAMLLLHGGRIEQVTTTNIAHSLRNWSSWKPMIGQSFRSTWTTTGLK